MLELPTHTNILEECKNNLICGRNLLFLPMAGENCIFLLPRRSRGKNWLPFLTSFCARWIDWELSFYGPSQHVKLLAVLKEKVFHRAAIWLRCNCLTGLAVIPALLPLFLSLFLSPRLSHSAPVEHCYSHLWQTWKYFHLLFLFHSPLLILRQWSQRTTFNCTSISNRAQSIII